MRWKPVRAADRSRSRTPTGTRSNCSNPRPDRRTRVVPSFVRHDVASAVTAESRHAPTYSGPIRPLAAVGAVLYLAIHIAAQSPVLRIVVVEGEDGVNIVQQKTAVAPVVEVRDRNDQPVSGAIVTFAIRSGRATFDGARTLTVTTNAAGRAVAAGLTPTGAGTVQIGASAAFQGQTAAVTIAQTNVMTAAQAASASTAGVASGGGGGIGVGTIAAIGAGVAGGAVGYQQIQEARKGDPPEMGPLEMIPRAGFQNATTFLIGGAPGSGGV